MTRLGFVHITGRAKPHAARIRAAEPSPGDEGRGRFAARRSGLSSLERAIPMEKRRKPASESLRALHEFLLGHEEDIRDVPLESIKAELKKEGIDTDPMVREIRKRLADAAAARIRAAEPLPGDDGRGL